LNFLLWPKVYLLGIPKKAGALPCAVKNKNIAKLQRTLAIFIMLGFLAGFLAGLLAIFKKR
jgi:hypothetical protein